MLIFLQFKVLHQQLLIGEEVAFEILIEFSTKFQCT